MKNKIRTLLIAFICMAATLSSVPASVNPFETTTVEAATIEKNGLYHEGSNWNYYTDNAINKSSTLVKYNGSWWYVRDGQVCWKNVSVSGDDFVTYNGYRYGCKNGQVDWNCKIEKSHVHKYNSGVVTKAPTCTDTGIKTYTCVNNDDSYTETIPELGHDPVTRTETVTTKEAYDEDVLEPRYICCGCGAQFKTATEACDHILDIPNDKCGSYYEDDVKVNTIHHPAETKTNTYKVCSRCGKRL